MSDNSKPPMLALHPDAVDAAGSESSGGSSVSSFDNAVRTLARRKGWNVSDDEPVLVEMTEEWSGWSEFTITSQWDQFTVQCGEFVGRYDNDNLGRTDYQRTPKSALAKLWDDLNGDGT